MNRREGETVEIECTVVYDTELAWLIDDGYIKAWLPKSLTRWANEPVYHVVNVATISRRLADEKGLT